MRGWLVVVALGLALGVAASNEWLDAKLSHFFAYLLPLAGGIVLAVWLGQEIWQAAQDWSVMGAPDLGSWRRRPQRDEQEEVPR